MKERTNWTSQDTNNLLASLCKEDIISSIRDESLKQRLLDYCSQLKDAEATETALARANEEKIKIANYHEMFQNFSINELYPFNCFFFKRRKVLVFANHDGKEYVFSRVFGEEDRELAGYYGSLELDSQIQEVKEESVSHLCDGIDIPEGFISREEFEESVIGPMLKVDGRILSIPREDRFKLIVTYTTPFTSSLGYPNGDNTSIGCIDLLTGFGGYPGGRLLPQMKESIIEEVNAKTFQELNKANREYHDRK